MKNTTIVFYCETQNSTLLYKLPHNQAVPVAECYAYSTLISLAGFFVWKFPYLPTPGVDRIVGPTFREETFPDRLALTHQMFNFWVDFLMNELLTGNALRQDDTLYLKIKVSRQYGRILFQNGFEKQQLFRKITWKDIQATLNEQILRYKQKGKNVLLITCSISKVKKVTYHAPAKIAGTFFNNQNWKMFWIMYDQFPTEKDYETATQIIIPGSTLNFTSPEKEPRVIKLMKQLKLTLQTNKKVKFLGLCYGHQLISQLLKPGSVKRTAGYFGLYKVERSKEQVLRKYTFLRNYSSAVLLKLHYEQVTEVPDEFIKVAESNTGCVDMMVSSDGRIFSLQGHPEYSYLRYRTLLALDKMQKQDLTHEQMIEMIEEKYNAQEGTLTVQEMCQQFLLAE